MCISNSRASFHLWLTENLVKHQKVSKYENDCSSRFLDPCLVEGSCEFGSVHLSVRASVTYFSRKPFISFSRHYAGSQRTRVSQK